MPLPDPVTSATLPCSDGTADEEQSVRRASTDVMDVAASGERATRRIASAREARCSAGLAVLASSLFLREDHAVRT